MINCMQPIGRVDKIQYRNFDLADVFPATAVLPPEWTVFGIGKDLCNNVHRRFLAADRAGPKSRHGQS